MRTGRAILISAALALSDGQTNASPRPAPPIAQQGVLDLRSWDFDRDGPVSLDGDWQFHWEVFLAPSAPLDAVGPHPVAYISLKSWVDHEFAAGHLPPGGSATFRLRVLLSEPSG